MTSPISLYQRSWSNVEVEESELEFCEILCFRIFGHWGYVCIFLWNPMVGSNLSSYSVFMFNV